MEYSYGYNYPDVYITPEMTGVLTGTYMFSLAIGILSIVAMWMLFQKAHEEGWASIIPLYNTYVLYKITWGNGWYFLFLLIPLANVIIAIITMVKLAKVFGKGGGFACGLIFLNTIFLCILAFSKDIQYVGIPGQYHDGDSSGGQSQGFQSPYSQTTTQQSSQNSNYYYQQTDAPQGPKFCPKCGAALEPGAKFCPSCGQAL